ncbi:hypothetical protein K443DRAFT_15366 [Laccaria amethystina LaAM-08-1]|uniref:Uncharacterized protein n=1 Tax=Laccaria amethystina LaAM-08-1 TaxID=1095629 RepID=A0A0C9WY05_9AGAR|nr:hypothetical protein K443DRAFT_15366 [Laccaria amethystina LaAM-08-1]
MLRHRRRSTTSAVGLPLVSTVIDSTHSHVTTRTMPTGRRTAHPGQQTRDGGHATYVAWHWKRNHGAPRTTNSRGQRQGAGESETPQQDNETRCTQDSKREASAPMPPPARTTPMRDHAPRSGNEGHRPCHVHGMGAGELDTRPTEPQGTSLMPRTTYAYVAWALGNQTNTQSTTTWQRQGDDDTTRQRQRQMPKTRLRGEATTTPPRDATTTHDPTTRDVAMQQHETRAARRNDGKSLW